MVRTFKRAQITGRSLLLMLVMFSLLTATATIVLRSAAQERDARVVWQKSVQQANKVPMRARMSVTLWKRDKTVATLAQVTQGPNGVYVMRYEAPAEARGRIVYADGTTQWQIEPKRNLVTKMPLAPHREDTEANALLERNYRFRLASTQEHAAGRSTYLLELVPIHAGKGRQRRWIDRQNFKTLRIETYYADGTLARVVSYQQVSFPASIAASEFRPQINKNAHVVSRPGASSTTPADQLVQQAQTLGLKADSNTGFHLTQVAARTVGKSSVTQMLYTDGIETVSVFVREGGALRPSAKDWSRVSLKGVAAYHQRREHTDALVWARGGRHYTAVSHLEPEALQAFAAEQIR